jgi:competence protein ComEC
MVGWVELLARLPLTQVDGRSPSALWLLAVYAVSGLWVYRRRWMPWRHGYKVAAVVLILAWLVPPRWLRADHDALQVWMLAVGNGTGTVIELPNGQVLVYDLGTRSNLDAGRVAADFLTHRGIRRLDAVFVSHPNLDHFSGIETLAKEFEIGRVVLNDQFERFATRGTSGWHFLETMRRAGVPIEVTSGHHVFADTGDVLVEAIWPPPVVEQMTPDENECSTVLRLSYQGRSILLTGDIAEFGMAHLLAADISHADVLALPHHGSVVYNTGVFIDAVDPTIYVRSAGQPARLTISGIETLAGDRRYFNTADAGCVHVKIEDGDLSVEAVGR